MSGNDKESEKKPGWFWKKKKKTEERMEESRRYPLMDMRRFLLPVRNGSGSSQAGSVGTNSNDGDGNVLNLVDKPPESKPVNLSESGETFDGLDKEGRVNEVGMSGNETDPPPTVKINEFGARFPDDNDRGNRKGLKHAAKPLASDPVMDRALYTEQAMKAIDGLDKEGRVNEVGMSGNETAPPPTVKIDEFGARFPDDNDRGNRKGLDHAAKPLASDPVLDRSQDMELAIAATDVSNQQGWANEVAITGKVQPAPALLMEIDEFEVQFPDDNDRGDRQGRVNEVVMSGNETTPPPTVKINEFGVRFPDDNDRDNRKGLKHAAKPLASDPVMDRALYTEQAMKAIDGLDKEGRVNEVGMSGNETDPPPTVKINEFGVRFPDDNDRDNRKGLDHAAKPLASDPVLDRSQDMELAIAATDVSNQQGWANEVAITGKVQPAPALLMEIDEFEVQFPDDNDRGDRQGRVNEVGMSGNETAPPPTVKIDEFGARFPDDNDRGNRKGLDHAAKPLASDPVMDRALYTEQAMKAIDGLDKEGRVNEVGMSENEPASPPTVKINEFGVRFPDDNDRDNRKGLKHAAKPLASDPVMDRALYTEQAMKAIDGLDKEGRVNEVGMSGNETDPPPTVKINEFGARFPDDNDRGNRKGLDHAAKPLASDPVLDRSQDMELAIAATDVSNQQGWANEVAITGKVQPAPALLMEIDEFEVQFPDDNDRGDRQGRVNEVGMSGNETAPPPTVKIDEFGARFPDDNDRGNRKGLDHAAKPLASDPVMDRALYTEQAMKAIDGLDKEGRVNEVGMNENEPASPPTVKINEFGVRFPDDNDRDNRKGLKHAAKPLASDPVMDRALYTEQAMKAIDGLDKEGRVNEVGMSGNETDPPPTVKINEFGARFPDDNDRGNRKGLDHAAKPLASDPVLDRSQDMELAIAATDVSNQQGWANEVAITGKVQPAPALLMEIDEFEVQFPDDNDRGDRQGRVNEVGMSGNETAPPPTVKIDEFGARFPDDNDRGNRKGLEHAAKPLASDPMMDRALYTEQAMKAIDGLDKEGRVNEVGMSGNETDPPPTVKINEFGARFPDDNDRGNRKGLDHAAKPLASDPVMDRALYTEQAMKAIDGLDKEGRVNEVGMSGNETDPPPTVKINEFGVRFPDDNDRDNRKGLDHAAKPLASDPVMDRALYTEQAMKAIDGLDKEGRVNEVGMSGNETDPPPTVKINEFGVRFPDDNDRDNRKGLDHAAKPLASDPVLDRSQDMELAIAATDVSNQQGWANADDMQGEHYYFLKLFRTILIPY
ncbi:uncharacterized protein LOC120422306 [Culex pipiens pallens]|uniref:uncharacterized protein LOC120422306 n=1 Tax=Culex pipiens pallens TaxID=42434 RepID=UPI0019546B07|nr:uncharacterized protein LOC120422306 [Culex pipiens pallens]